MEAGYEEAVLYERRPIALGELEKTLSKEHRQAILSKYPGEAARLGAAEECGPVRR